MERRRQPWVVAEDFSTRSSADDDTLACCAEADGLEEEGQGDPDGASRRRLA